jgi:hypothetical protein
VIAGPGGRCGQAGAPACLSFVAPASLKAPGPAPETEAVCASALEPNPQARVKGDLRLTFLESNSWFWSLGDVNILVDPVMYNLDFGVPSLISGKKMVRPPEHRSGMDMTRRQTVLEPQA